MNVHPEELNNFEVRKIQLKKQKAFSWSKLKHAWSSRKSRSSLHPEVIV
jgi:hypothetical protein